MNLTAQFGNIQQVRRVIYATTTGVAPGVWVLWAMPQESSIQPYGTLTFGDGTTSLSLTNCKLLRQDVEYGMNGPELKLVGADRRVYWHGKAIDGRYNVRTVDGQILSGTERTPQQLAQLLWAAMGEPNASVTALPNGDRPEVNWDCDDAAAELESLCARYGCEPTLDIASNTAGIVVKGVGATLPNNPDVRWTQNTTQGVLPTRVEACSGHLNLQSKLKLRAVLRDTDGQLKLADEVEYAPSGGWDGNVSDINDPLLPDNPNYSLANAELAKDLWKLWSVESFADGTLTFGPLGSVNSRQDLLPISDNLLAPYSEDDGEFGEDAHLLGTTAIPNDPDIPTENTDAGTRLDIPFTVDGARGLVRTSVPVPKRVDNAYGEADLFIVCTHKFRDTSTGQYARYVRFNSPGGVGGVFTARRPDIVPVIIGQYGTGAAHTQLTGVTDNADFVNQTLDIELAILLGEHSPVPAMIREYNGVQAIPIDGAVRFVKWTLNCEPRADKRNCVTEARYQIDGDGSVVSPRERGRHQLAVALSVERDRLRLRSRLENRRRPR